MTIDLERLAEDINHGMPALLIAGVAHARAELGSPEMIAAEEQLLEACAALPIKQSPEAVVVGVARYAAHIIDQLCTQTGLDTEETLVWVGLTDRAGLEDGSPYCGRGDRSFLVEFRSPLPCLADWSKVTRMDHLASESRALALWAAGEKISVIVGVSDSRVQDREVLAAVAEACWWLASLDEDLRDAYKETYTRAREADSEGVLLKGIRWARHRHSHDLLTTSRGDVRPFLYNEPEGLFYISSAYKWRSVESMNLQGSSATSMPDQRERYTKLLEGNPVLPSLEAALRWLTKSVDVFSRPK